MKVYWSLYRNVLIAIFMVILCFSPAIASGQQHVMIGVLANLGKQTVLQMWSPTATYLTKTISDYTFTIVPFDFDEISLAVERQQVDFVLTNPGIYVQLEHDYVVTRIATLDTAWAGKVFNMFGGVIFTKANRQDIVGLDDLKGKSFMAVHETSYGGWEVALRELHEVGIDPARHFSKLLFPGVSQESVVFAVLNNEVDAGTVRTGILESLVQKGEIHLQDFKIINRQKVAEFPFMLSTRLYPEWAFARLRHTSDELAKKTAAALLSMPANSPAAKSSNIAGFTVPCNYQPIHELMQELRIGPYKNYGDMTLGMFAIQYRYWFITMLVLLAVSGGLILRYENRLRRARGEIEKRVGLRTIELESAIEQLKTSEQYNRVLFEHSVIGLTLARLDGSFVDVNESFAGIIGRTIEESLALSSGDITPAKFADHEEQRLTELHTTGHYLPFEKEYIHKDGHLVPVWLQGQIVEQDGEMFIWSSVVDITDRKRAELAFKENADNLEKQVAERTETLQQKTVELESSQKALQRLLEDVNVGKKQLEQKLVEIERMNKLFVDRELRMIELKQRIRELEEAAGNKGNQL